MVLNAPLLSKLELLVPAVLVLVELERLLAEQKCYILPVKTLATVHTEITIAAICL